MKDKDITLFELGLSTNNIDIPSNMGVKGKPGAFLYGWREYFLNAKIYGADIDKRTTVIKEIHPQLHDIIIDDGLHEFAAIQSYLTIEGWRHLYNRGPKHGHSHHICKYDGYVQYIACCYISTSIAIWCSKYG